MYLSISIYIYLYVSLVVSGWIFCQKTFLRPIPVFTTAAHAAYAAQCLSDKSDVGPIHPSFFVTFGKKHDAGSSSEVHESWSSLGVFLKVHHPQQVLRGSQTFLWEMDWDFHHGSDGHSQVRLDDPWS